MLQTAYILIIYEIMATDKSAQIIIADVEGKYNLILFRNQVDTYGCGRYYFFFLQVFKFFWQVLVYGLFHLIENFVGRNFFIY